jgi:Fe2+ transport system protein FeoA
VEKTPDAIPLSRLPQGQEAEVVEIDPSVQGFTRRRFLDLGLTPGARVVPELSNFFGDPRAYRLRGTLIALRQDQAEKIWVRRSQNNPTEAL